MPMEVYTINGAVGPSMMSPDMIKAASGNSGTTVTVPVAPAVALQNALKALGNTAGDPKLSGLHVDGVIGPATVTAVNYALANYVGGTPAFPRADLTVVRVRQNAAALAVLVTQRVQKSGGAVPAPQVDRAPARRTSAGAPSLPPGLMPSDAGGGAPKWIWWVVGGVSVLLVLSMAAGVARKQRVPVPA